MVLSIPTTWLEDLGAARRVSRYEITTTGEDTSGRYGEGPVYHWYIAADLELPDGSVERKDVHVVCLNPQGPIGGLKGDFRKFMRRKYPKE